MTIIELRWVNLATFVCCMLGLTVVAILHQRFIKGRSWRSILLGERRSGL